MNANTIAAQGYELISRRPQVTRAPGKSLFRRIFEKMAANAERQAMARLAAADPRLAAELRAAKDRHEAQALI